MSESRTQSFVTGVRRLALAPLRFIYGLYALCAFLVIAFCAFVATLAVPGVERRRAAARAASRAFLWVAGMRLTVKSLELLPPGQCVVVSNHVSYIDGLIYTAALPPRFGFVIKREMSDVPVIGLFLRRLGSEFVERFNRHRSAADARRVLRTAISGHSLAFFPEGTFTKSPGLLKFHSGAFMTAARAGCPVVPAVVKGTRLTLPPTSHWPHPGRIVVELFPPLVATNSKPDSAAVELRESARAVILRALGEPDLSDKQATESENAAAA
jgi:1-acyl-sn-glycerol-3-phosphate acyltransferase